MTRSSTSTPPTVYITGGSQGIGLAIARAYRARGANLALFARSAERLVQARDSLREVDGGDARVEVFPMDVTHEGQVAAGFDRAEAALGPPDILVNSAGLIAGNRFERIPSAEFDAVVRTNVLGPANTIRQLLPALRARRGRIVNIASVAGLVGIYGYTAYSASKYALVGFSESLRYELKPDGVSVTLVCPPEVPTAMVEHEDRTLPRAAKVIKHLAGVLSADAVARAVVRGAGRRQFLVVPGVRARATSLAHVLSLGVLSRLTGDLVISWLESGRRRLGTAPPRRGPNAGGWPPRRRGASSRAQ